MRFPNQKRVQPLLDAAKEEGFDVSRTQNGHLKLSRPGCPSVYTGSTPGDTRSVKNAVARMRRAKRDSR